MYEYVKFVQVQSCSSLVGIGFPAIMASGFVSVFCQCGYFLERVEQFLAEHRETLQALTVAAASKASASASSGDSKAPATAAAADAESKADAGSGSGESKGKPKLAKGTAGKAGAAEAKFEIPVVLGGDLNSLPARCVLSLLPVVSDLVVCARSDVYRLLSSGQAMGSKFPFLAPDLSPTPRPVLLSRLRRPHAAAHHEPDLQTGCRQVRARIRTVLA
jgi:hypothetical protein